MLVVVSSDDDEPVKFTLQVQSIPDGRNFAEDWDASLEQIIEADPGEWTIDDIEAPMVALGWKYEQIEFTSVSY